MEYITGYGIRYANEIPTIRKKKDTPLQPVFEAITNSWEAIREKYTDEHINLGHIKVSIYHISNALSEAESMFDFEKFCVSDNGQGLDDKSYSRLINLRDDSKNFLNKGTGRIQYVHFFDETIIESVYRKDASYRKKIVTLSKKDAFLQQNAIIRLDTDEAIDATDSLTMVTFQRPLDKADWNYYYVLKLSELKEEILKHFLALFCDNKSNLPRIDLEYYEDGVLQKELKIEESDVPNPDKEDTFEVHYSRLNGKKIEEIEQSEEFSIKSFVQPVSTLSENAIYMVSKGERASKIKLESIAAKDCVNGNRYLFLLSSPYIDSHNRDDRGNILLATGRDFRAQNSASLFPEEVILLDSIQEETNKTIGVMYNEIEETTQETRQNLEELQKMFLLNPHTVDTLKNKIKNTDTDEEILRKVYESDAEIKAKQDAEIKQKVKDIESLMPTDADYQEKLEEKVNEFVSSIPLKNRTALSQYIAHRKLVLDIFDNIMNRVRQGENINEEILHNLIFQKGNTDPENSDLWLIGDEYIYFKGTSDKKLSNIEYEGEKIIKGDDELTEEEKAYKVKCEHDAGDRKPDILLFPQEGKCIIIEFKAPHVDVSDHLHQINRYARLIHNLSRDQYHFMTYYGYLIGQNIDIDEIRDSEPEYKSAASLNYIFRPHMTVAAKFGRKDGDLYTEIIKYSDLLDRAQLRNKMFVKKLEHGNDE